MVRAAPPRLPSRGSFEHQCAVGVFSPAAGDAERHRVYHGLSLESTICAGTFRDSAGVVYAGLRRLGSDWALPLVLQSAGDTVAMRAHVDAAERAWAGAGLEETVEDGVHRYWSRPRGPARPFRLSRGVDEIEWEETDALAVRGSLVGGVGLQWYDPSPPGAFHASQMYRASGTVLGRSVEGFVAFEQRYLPPGQIWTDAGYQGPGGLQAARTIFGTEWDDGTVETGLLCAGRRQWAVAIVAGSAGPVLATTAVAARVRRGDAGWSERVLYRIRADEWEWIADPHGRMPDVPPWVAPGSLVSEGLVRRADDARWPVAWMGRTEVAPSRSVQSRPSFVKVGR